MRSTDGERLADCMQDLQDQRETNDSLREQLEKTKQESVEKGSVRLRKLHITVETYWPMWTTG
jgi:cell shape-determining protein MreC